MEAALRRPWLETAILGVLPLTIVAVACASSWSPGLRAVAGPVRAGAIVALCILAVAYASRRPPSVAVRRAPYVLVGAFVLLAVVSAVWAVDAGAAVAKAGALALLLTAAAALGAAVARDGRVARRILLALLAGATIVALLGVAVYAVSPDSALQAETVTDAERFRGVGQNPNTVSMLLAVALPIAAFFVVEARAAWSRLAAAAALALFGASIAFSGSRGAFVGAVVGLLAFGLIAARRRVAATVAIGAFALAVAAIASLPQPLVAPAATTVDGPAARGQPRNAEHVLRLEDEVGYSQAGAKRDLVSGSGRVDAWEGALEQAAERPLAGYGFGSEANVFVDRFQRFQGGVPENSFLGVLLQLGALGLALFVSVVVALGIAARRALQRDRALVSACIGVATAGLALSLVQSFVYAVGNVATLTVWIAAFLPAARAAE